MLERTIRSLTRYKGIIVGLRLDAAELEGGAGVLREVVEHPGGVAVIPVDDDGYVRCVRQFRYPFGEVLLEVPAGKLEQGEEPLSCAVRELSEETGLKAERMIPLGYIYPSPGYCGEKLYIYLARGLSEGTAHPDENEILVIENVHIDALTEMIAQNEIVDAKTVAAVFRARLYLGREQGGQYRSGC